MAISYDTGGVVLGADVNWGSLHYLFNGLLDDIRVYDHVLSNAEVLALSTSP